jgi:hypothetical protein
MPKNVSPKRSVTSKSWSTTSSPFWSRAVPFFRNATVLSGLSTPMDASKAKQNKRLLHAMLPRKNIVLQSRSRN